MIDLNTQKLRSDLQRGQQLGREHNGSSAARKTRAYTADRLTLCGAWPRTTDRERANLISRHRTDDTVPPRESVICLKKRGVNGNTGVFTYLLDLEGYSGQEWLETTQAVGAQR